MDGFIVCTQNVYICIQILTNQLLFVLFYSPSIPTLHVIVDEKEYVK